MMSINLKFLSLREIHLDAIARGVFGVYVLYGSKSRVLPTKIGEGVILNRFAAHLNAGILGNEVEGFMSIIDRDTNRNNKIYAQIAEAALFLIAEETDRLPVHSKNPRKSILLDNLERFGKIKVYVSGFDPFLRTKINERKVCELFIDHDIYDKIGISRCDWKMRSIGRGHRK